MKNGRKILTELRKIGYTVSMSDEITIGRQGAITLPASLRKRFGLAQNDKLIVEETDQGLLLRPAVSMPVEMYSEERIAEFQQDEAVIGDMLDALNID